LSAADAVTEKLRAKELYDRVLKVLDSPSFATESSKQHQSSRSLKSVMHLGDDVDMYVEIAALWQRDNLERTGKALKDAVRVNNAQAKSVSTSPSNISTPKLLNNLAAVRHIEGSFAEARALYEEALPSALAEGTVDSEASSVTILYNLARVYEDLAENNMARDAYLKLLARHPEYVDGASDMISNPSLRSKPHSVSAKARLAVMRMEEKRYDEAHSLIKQALASGDKNPEIRAFYIYLLCHTGQMKPAKAFTFNVLKDDGHDVYALCAAGRLSYQEARESRDPSPAATTARKENFLKAANIFVKALNIDPSCAIAAQGLAIIIAEDSLGSWAPGQAADDSQFKMRNAQNARQALDILAKVRESLIDGSVYVNMGHCHFVREEYDKAIENVCMLSSNSSSKYRSFVLRYSTKQRQGASIMVRTSLY
jgi:RNA polymerase-associated protein CTR9